MVNQTFLHKLRKNLNNNKYFGSNDFSMTEEYNSLKIAYNYDENYFFELNIPQEASKLIKTQRQSGIGMFVTSNEVEYQAYEFSGRLNPGSISNTENFICEGENNLNKFINTWLNNLWNELSFAPELRIIKDIEVEIEKINERFENFSEDFFSNSEIINLSEKLEKLEEQFREKLEKEIQDKENLKTTLEELHIEIEKLKGQSKILNKKNWFKSFGGKIFVWISKDENRKFLKDVGDFIQPLLPDSVNKLP